MQINRAVYDIESIPKEEYEPAEFEGEEPEVYTKVAWEDVPSSKGIKDEDKQLAYRMNKEAAINKKGEEAYLKAMEKYNVDYDKFMQADLEAHKDKSLNFYTNQIISISIKINGNPVQNFAGPKESDLIKQFCEYVYSNHIQHRWLWVGHYIKGFDTPGLRAKIQRLSNWMKKNTPSEQNIFKEVLRQEWFLPDVIPYLRKEVAPDAFDFYCHLPCPTKKVRIDGRESYGQSLDNVLKFYGFPGKEDVDGSDIYDLYCCGKLDLISAYNIEEVSQMANLYDSLDFPWSERFNWRNNKIK